MKTSFSFAVATFIVLTFFPACTSSNQASLPPDPLVQLTPSGLAQATVFTTFDSDKLLEGIAIDKKGSLYVSEITAGQVFQITLDGKPSVVATLPMGTSVFAGGRGSVSTLAFGRDGNLYIGVNNGLDSTAHGLWQINPATKQARLYVPLPLAVRVNGIAFDSTGNVFFTDPQGGAIWKVKSGETRASLWLRDTSFTSNIPGFPGINGLQVASNNVLYAAVSAKGYVIAVQQLSNGAAGTPTIVRSGINGDDFAIDREGNFFVTTHPFNTVERITSDFTQSRVIANASNGVLGAAAAAFGTSPGDTGNLYVVTDGGLFGFDPSRPRGKASIVKLSVYKN